MSKMLTAQHHVLSNLRDHGPGHFDRWRRICIVRSDRPAVHVNPRWVKYCVNTGEYRVALTAMASSTPLTLFIRGWIMMDDEKVILTQKGVSALLESEL